MTVPSTASGQNSGFFVSPFTPPGVNVFTAPPGTVGSIPTVSPFDSLGANSFASSGLGFGSQLLALQQQSVAASPVQQSFSQLGSMIEALTSINNLLNALLAKSGNASAAAPAASSAAISAAAATAPAAAKPAPAPKPSGPNVAIIDDFKGLDGTIVHGNAVDSVLAGNDPNAVIQHIQQSGETTFNPSDLNGSIATLLSSPLNDTSSSLEQILNNPNSAVKTVNISLGISKVDVMTALTGSLTTKRLATALGLANNATAKQVQQALSDRIDQISASNAQIQQAKARYDNTTAQLAQRGVAIVVAAGNNGVDTQRLVTQGINLSADSSLNFLTNNNVIVAGASNDTGANAGIASFSAPSGNVTVTADGTSVKTNQGALNGTSFASPEVAATVAKMQAANPNLTFAQIVAILKSTATDTAVAANLEGAGNMNAQQAVAAAAAA
jgi:hypothetical protein